MATMDICEVRVLRRKKALLMETLPTENGFLGEFLRQGLLDKHQTKNIARVESEGDRIDALLDDLTSNPGITLYKICFLLERCGLEWVSDELQAEYQWEMGQLQIEKYVQVEAEQLVGRLADDNNLDQPKDSLVSIASNLAAHVQVTKATWQRQLKRHGTKQSDEVRKLEEDISRVGDEVGNVLAKKDSVLHSQSKGSVRDEFVQSRQGNLGGESERLGEEPAENSKGFDRGEVSSKSRVGVLQEDKLESSQDSTRDSGIGRISEGPNNDRADGTLNSYDSVTTPEQDVTRLEQDVNIPKQDGDNGDSIQGKDGSAPTGGGKLNDSDKAAQNTDQAKPRKPLLIRNASVRQLSSQIRELSETLDLMVEDQRQLKEERDTCYALLGYNPVDGQLNEILESALADISQEISFAKANDHCNEERIEELQEHVRVLRREMSKPKDMLVEPPPSRNETPRESKDLKEEIELLQAESEYWQKRCDVLEKTRRLGYYYVSLVNGVRFHQPYTLQNDRKLSKSMVTYDPEDMELQNGQLLFREDTGYSGRLSRKQSRHSAGPIARRPASGLTSRPHSTGQLRSASSSRKGSVSEQRTSARCSRSSTPQKGLITPTLRNDGSDSRNSLMSLESNNFFEQNGTASPIADENGDTTPSRQSTPDDPNAANRRWTMPAYCDKNALAVQKKLAKDIYTSRDSIKGLPPVDHPSESSRVHQHRQSSAGRRSHMGSRQTSARSCASPACPIDGHKAARKSISNRRTSENNPDVGNTSRRPSCAVHQVDIDAGRRPSCTHLLDPELVKQRLEQAVTKQRLPPRRDPNIPEPVYCTCCTKCCPRGDGP